MPTHAHTEEVKRQELAYDIKFLLVVILLFVMYPVGLILMWVWMKWPTWVKVVISLPIFLVIFFFFVAMIAFVGIVHHGMENRQMAPYYKYYQGYYRQPMQRMMLSPTATPTGTLSPTPAAY